MLYEVITDGTGVERLTETDDHATIPVWSPHSDVLLFSKVAADETFLGLHVLDLHRRKVTRISSGSEREACWSPDGKRIAYYSYRDRGGDHVAVKHADGSGDEDVITSYSIHYTKLYEN